MFVAISHRNAMTALVKSSSEVRSLLKLFDIIAELFLNINIFSHRVCVNVQSPMAAFLKINLFSSGL